MEKRDSIVPKHIPSESEPKAGAEEIRRAYFKSWYDSCSDLYNKERRKKRKEKREEERRARGR